ncbi:MAG: hypothetical protein JW709_06970 [Sedimentisphaerales bacterium]|nr:hypothetical protein [Sedimentisphaerales bacterium]
MASHLGYQLKALGKTSLPVRICMGGRCYHRDAIFKHDFFAATAAYKLEGNTHESNLAGKVVLKVHRCGSLWGWPMIWLGNILVKHEIANLQHLAGMKNVPRLLARYGSTGLVYEYIEGYSLDEKPVLKKDFFDSLEFLLKEIHQKNMAYIDLNKRGNILIRPDGQAALIDFQIAVVLLWRKGITGWPAKRLLKRLQAADRYHLLKHKRRFLGDLLSDAERAESYRITNAIKWHRRIILPLTRLRRRLLGRLYRGDHLALDDTTVRHSESCPERWLR